MQRKYNRWLLPAARELRKNMTKEERHLWYDFLKAYPTRFIRQKIIGKYIVDFYCAQARLVIEIDGSGHYTEEGELYDKERTEFLSKYGLSVVRVTNLEIARNFQGVCEYIDMLVQQSLSQLR